MRLRLSMAWPRGAAFVSEGDPSALSREISSSQQGALLAPLGSRLGCRACGKNKD